MARLVGYWHMEGLEVFRLVGNKLEKQASGKLDELKPVSGLFSKKILIVGRELLFHIRKRYPPAPAEKLTKAVALEIGNIFPLSKPAFHCRVHESSGAHTTLDIWAWETEPYARLREVFPFHYVVPEDLVCFSEVPEVKVWQHRGMTHMLASSGDQFLGGASYPDSGIEEREVERFLSGLGRYGSDIKQIKIYGPLAFKFQEAGISVTRLMQGAYPPCLDNLSRLNLNELRAKREHRLPLKADFLMRVLIYLAIGYGLMLYLTAKNYDQAAIELRQKIREIDAGMSNRESGKTVTDFSEVVREVNEKLSSRLSPLKVMDRLAQSLPMESLISRMVLNENTLEVSATSKDPLSVVKALGNAGGVKAARLKGPPARNSQTGVYSFTLTIEFLR